MWQTNVGMMCRILESLNEFLKTFFHQQYNFHSSNKLNVKGTENKNYKTKEE